MDRKTTGIIATLAAVLLCGCPGLVFLLAGGISALVSQVPGADIDIAGRNDPGAALGAGIGLLCLGLLFVAIPVVIGVLLLRSRPAAPVPAPGVNVYTPPSTTSVYTPPSTPPETTGYTPPSPPPAASVDLPPSTPPETPPTVVPPAEKPPYTPPPEEPAPPDETLPPTS